MEGGKQGSELYSVRFREINTESIDEGMLNGVGIDTDFGGLCNQRCVQCYKPDTTGKKQFIPVEQYQKILGNAKEAGAQEIYLLGKDTLQHPEIEDLVYNAVDEGFFTLLVTNGLKFGEDEELCKRIAGSGAGIVQQIRVVGKDQNTANVLGAVHGVRNEMQQNHLDKVNKAVGFVIDYFPQDKIVAQSCINRELLESGQTVEVYDFCIQNGIKPVIEMIKPTKGIFDRGHPSDVSLDELVYVLGLLGEVREKHKLESFHMHPTSYGNFCHMFRTGVHVGGPDFNEVYACDGQTSFMLGSLETQSLKEIAASQKRKDFIDAKNTRVGHCNDCDLYGSMGDTCDAGCNGANFNDTGCYKSSSTYCPQIVIKGVDLKYSSFLPESCDDCTLQKYDECAPRKEIPVYLEKNKLVLVSKDGLRTVDLVV